MVEGREVMLDKEGFLVDLADWSDKVAKALAKQEGLELTAAHFEVIHALRRFYA